MILREMINKWKGWKVFSRRMSLLHSVLNFSCHLFLNFVSLSWFESMNGSLDELNVVLDELVIVSASEHGNDAYAAVIIWAVSVSFNFSLLISCKKHHEQQTSIMFKSII